MSFVARVGEVLARPRRAVARIADGGGLLPEVLALVALRIVAGGAPLLLRAWVGVRWLGVAGSGAMALAAVGAVLPDVLAVVVAAVAMMLLAGRGAPPRELDLAAAAWVPFLAVEVAATILLALVGAAGATAPAWARHALEAVGLAWAAAVWALGLAALRARRRSALSPDAAPSRSPAAPPEPAPALSDDPSADRSASPGRVPPSAAAASHAEPAFASRAPLVAGGALLGALVALLAGHVAFFARHPDALRPLPQTDVAPDFALPLLGGGELRRAVTPAPPVTVIDFFATWCGPCREELPAVDRLARRYAGRGVRVVAVDVEARDAEPAVRALVEGEHLTLPVALGGEAVAAAYHVDNLPHVVVVDGAGIIRRVLLGLHAEEDLAAAIDDALR